MSTAERIRTRPRRGAKNRTVSPPPKRADHIGDLVDIQALEGDGLIVNSAGGYVRLIECRGVPNVFTADATLMQTIDRGWEDLCAMIPDHHRLSLYAQVDGLPIDDALEQDRRRVDAAIAADLERGNPDLARTRRRLAQAQRQTVTLAAGGEDPAVAARYWIAVPYRPTQDRPVERLRDLFGTPGGAVTMSWEHHQRAAIESLSYSRAILAQLSSMGIDARLMGPVEVLAAGWERLHPAARELPDLDAFADVADYVRATDRGAALAHRQKIVDALTSGTEPCSVDDRDPRWLRHADGTLEETLHLATTAALTTPWWLSLLTQVPLPATIAVHISVRDRQATRRRNRRHWARLRAAHRYKLRRDRLVGYDEEEALKEAAEVDRDLSSTVNGTLYDVGVYASIRHPDGDAEDLDRRIAALAKTFEGATDARVMRGRFLGRRGIQSTMPFGSEALRVTRRYAPLNVSHCTPLTTAACGSPEGLLLGFSYPGNTLVRIDPYDEKNTTHVTLVIAPSGSGKTVTMNTLLSRGVAQGLSGFIIDRSSTANATGHGRSQGHYDALLSLVPGHRKVHVGGSAEDVINPWDVQDPRDVDARKLEMLLALHALLIGDTDASGDRHLSALEEALLRRAIMGVYRTCAVAQDHGEDLRPRETLLLDELDKIAATPAPGSSADDALVGPTVNALRAKLQPFTAGEPYEHIADLPTTVDVDSPLVLFDLAGAQERMVPAFILVIVDHIDQVVQRRRAQHLASGVDAGTPWAERQFLLVEEGWSITASAAAGSWLNEYARRSRHLYLWLIFVSQHFQDLDNPQGRALVENTNLTLCLPNIPQEDLAFAQRRGLLTDADVSGASSLPMHKGVYSTVYVVSPRGRGAVRVALGPVEYWICSNDPKRDQPRRIAALREANGVPWHSIRLLCTPGWYETRSERDG